MTDKKVINYYLSFYEVSKDLTEKQFYQFNMAIFKVMFFDEHIDNINFDDKILSLLWKSVKHSIEASIKGYCDKKSIPYNDLFIPLIDPLGNPLDNNANEKGNKKLEISNEKKEFSFSLSRETQYENVSSEYKEKLKEEIEKLNLSLSYEDFTDSLIAKGYKYKNFLLAYKTWCKKDFNKNKSSTTKSINDWSY